MDACVGFNLNYAGRSSNGAVVHVDGTEFCEPREGVNYSVWKRP